MSKYKKILGLSLGVGLVVIMKDFSEEVVFKLRFEEQIAVTQMKG